MENAILVKTFYGPSLKSLETFIFNSYREKTYKHIIREKKYNY